LLLPQAAIVNAVAANKIIFFMFLKI